jgi:hypothetical protein
MREFFSPGANIEPYEQHEASGQKTIANNIADTDPVPYEQPTQVDADCHIDDQPDQSQGNR